MAYFSWARDWVRRASAIWLLSGLSLFFAQSSIAEGSEHWQTVLEQDHVVISIYEGFGDYSLPKVKASTLVNGSVNDVFAIFEDLENYPSWLADCRTSRLVAQVDSHSNIAHLTFDAPWPVQDRDVVFYRQISVTENGGKVLEFSAQAEHAEAQACCVRVTKAEGLFRVEPVDGDDQTVLVSYEFVSDPGGSLPTWLAEYSVIDAPFNSFVKLRELAQAF